MQMHSNLHLFPQQTQIHTPLHSLQYLWINLQVHAVENIDIFFLYEINFSGSSQ